MVSVPSLNDSMCGPRVGSRTLVCTDHESKAQAWSTIHRCSTRVHYGFRAGHESVVAMMLLLTSKEERGMSIYMSLKIFSHLEAEPVERLLSTSCLRSVLLIHSASCFDLSGNHRHRAYRQNNDAGVLSCPNCWRYQLFSFLPIPIRLFLTGKFTLCYWIKNSGSLQGI